VETYPDQLTALRVHDLIAEVKQCTVVPRRQASRFWADLLFCDVYWTFRRWYLRLLVRRDSNRHPVVRRDQAVKALVDASTKERG
jgi:hypothetical protein